MDLNSYTIDAYYAITKAGDYVKFNDIERAKLIPNLIIILKRDLKSKSGPTRYGNYNFSYKFDQLDLNGEPTLFKIKNITCLEIIGYNNTVSSHFEGQPTPNIKAKIMDSEGNVDQIKVDFPNLKKLFENITLLSEVRNWEIYNKLKRLEKLEWSDKRKNDTIKALKKQNQKLTALIKEYDGEYCEDD